MLRFWGLSPSCRLLNIANYSSSLSTSLLSNSQKLLQASCMPWWSSSEMLAILLLLMLCHSFGTLPLSCLFNFIHSSMSYLARSSRSFLLFVRLYVKSLSPPSLKSSLGKFSGDVFGSWANTLNLRLIFRALWGRWGRFLARSQFLHRNSVSWMLRVAMEKKKKRKRKRNQKLRVVEDQECWLMERMRRRQRIRVLALPG